MSDAPKVSFFKKGKTRPATTRQRSPPPPPPTATTATATATTTTTTPTRDDASEVVLPARKSAPRLLSQGTKRARADEPAAAASDYDRGEGEGGAALDVNWAGGAASHVGAVRDILAGDEAEALLARKRPRHADAAADADDNDVGGGGRNDGLYRGQAAYTDRIVRSEDAPKKFRVGPSKAAAGAGTIRAATIIDYQPDVCKDYKETGYCGFGDSCKFLHDRGTYLAGWQLDKLAAAAETSGGGAAAQQSDSDSEEDVPFACLICRKPYTNPVVTRCGHYFCSACAIKRFAKTPRCLACGTPTGGIFNRADKVLQKLKRKGGKDGGGEEEGEMKGGAEGGVEVEGLGQDSESSEG